jgi:hypothetical protein
MTEPNESSGIDLSITLVHGTWARGRFIPTDTPWWGTYWFNEKSPFRTKLETELRRRGVTPQVESISWGGANSVLERGAAVSKLLAHLSGQSENTTQLIIGHSHGGNIALRALKDMESRVAKMHVVTLATPFLRLYPTWSGSAYWRFFIPVLLATFVSLFYAAFLWDVILHKPPANLPGLQYEYWLPLYAQLAHSSSLPLSSNFATTGET